MQWKTMLYRITFSLACLALVVACGAPEERYELEGEVTAVDIEGGKITVAHGPIEGFMDAMTMPFPLRRPQILNSAEAGDDIKATLVVKGNAYWLEEVVLSRSRADGSLAGDDAPSGPEIGTEVPDIELVNQDDTTFRLSDLRGKGVLMTFIYTRCPLVDFCPRMNNHFAAIERALAAQPELYERTHLLTVSFDPAFDTPELLRTFALQQPEVTEDTFAHWSFATGTQENLRTIAFHLGLAYQQNGEEIVHNLRTAFIAPDGTLQALYTGNQWTPEEVMADVRELFSES